MSTILHDLRYALRQLRRSPGFALVAVLTLALGIGVTATVFSVMRQVLLSPLPYPQPDRLVGVSLGWPANPASARQAGEVGEFVMRHSHSFDASTLVNQGSMAANLSGRDAHAASITLLEVSRGYFDTLGVQPALGRGFSAEEDLPGGPQAMVLSDGLWQSAFGGDRSIVGRTVRLNQESITVVGVMPKSFRAETYSPTRSLVEPQAWRALQAGPQNAGYCCRNYVMYARLAPGVSFAQAQAELQSLDPGLQHEHPEFKDWTDDDGRKWAPHLRLWPLSTVIAGEVHTSLVVMAWASAAVLLLACLNLAALNTARALKLEPEYALRSALGASPGRLLRLGFLEAGLLTLSGFAAAVLTSRLLVPVLLRQSPVPIPQLNSAAGLGTTLALASLSALIAMFLFGAPQALLALGHGRANLQPGLRQAGGTHSRNRGGQALLVLQMGLAIVLLSTASLLLGTFLRLRQQPLGFSAQKLVVFQTNLKGARYGSTAASQQFLENVLARLRRSPGVSSAAAINGLPLDRGLYMGGIYPDTRSQLTETIELRAVTPGYFHTMGLAVLEGREFADSDGPATLPAIVINETAARRWWPGHSAIGSRLGVGTDLKEGRRIVGVVADEPGRTRAEQPSIKVYLPVAQLTDKMTKMLNGFFATSFAVRLSANIDTAQVVARAVAEVDPEIPVARLTTMQEVVDHSVAAPRFFTELAEGFAGFGVLLTAIGLFGLLSYQVAMRTRELGVRMALGASRGGILRSVVLSSMRLALLGAMLGGATAWLVRPLLTRWVSENVVGAPPGEHHLLFNGAAALAVAILLLLVTTLVAALLPAWRASSVDPMQALRTE
jgi:predicted permease